ncbi:MAG: hypothetical protein QXO93_03825 [Acidilobaceae archaeon]
MVSYRLAVVFSAITAFILLAYIFNLLEWWPTVKVSLIIYWILLTPLYYFVVKGTVLALSKGLLSTSLAETALELLREKYRFRYYLYTSVFYLSLIAWILVFIAFVILG